MSLPETGVKLVAENERGFFAALNRSTGAVDDFQAGTQRASVGTIALGTSIGNLISGGLSMVARTASQAGQALASFVGQGINEAAALEAQMSGIAAVTGASSEEMEQLNTLILDLGLDPNLTVSTVEAAQAIEMLGKNGVSVTEILDGMALSTVQLANATASDFAAAADLSTDIMNIFASEGVSMAQAVDGVTAVVNSSKFDMHDYALALSNGGGAAQAMGVELADFNAMLAGTASMFSSGATAGTGLKNMLRRLVPSTEKASDEMARLGLITEEGQNVFFDAEGNLKSMSEVSRILSDSLGGMSEQQRSSTIATIFGGDATEALLATMAAGAPIYEDAQAAMDGLGLSFEEATAFIEAGGNQVALANIQMANVDAADSAATRVDNFAGAMDILGGIVEGIRIQIGDKFLPVLKDLAVQFGDFISNNADGFIDFFSNAAEFVGVFFDTLLGGDTILESFLTAVANVAPEGVSEKITLITESINNFIIKVSEFVSEHSETFIGALKGIGAVLAGAVIVAGIASITAALGALLSPIGLIIVAAALLGAAWENNWGGIQEKTAAVIEFIKPLITEAITFIKEWWAVNGDEILLKAGETWEAIKEAIQTAVVFIRDSVIVPVMTGLATFWAAHGEAIKENTIKIWNFIKFGIESTLKNIKSIFDVFKAAFQGDWETFGAKIREIWDRKWEEVQTAFDTWGRDFLIKVSTMITDTIKKFSETDWKQVGIDIINGLINGIMNMRQAFIDNLTGIISAGADAVDGFLGRDSPSKLFMEVGTDIGKGLSIGINSTDNMVETASLGMVERAIRPMTATPGQIMNNSTTIDNSSRTVNFTGNFANQPTITDRSALIQAMATT